MQDLAGKSCSAIDLLKYSGGTCWSPFRNKQTELFSRFDTMSDAALLARICSGNAVVIASVYLRHGASVYRFAYRPRARRVQRQIARLVQAGADSPQ